MKNTLEDKIQPRYLGSGSALKMYIIGLTFSACFWLFKALSLNLGNLSAYCNSEIARASIQHASHMAIMGSTLSLAGLVGDIYFFGFRANVKWKMLIPLIIIALFLSAGFFVIV